MLKSFLTAAAKSPRLRSAGSTSNLVVIFIAYTVKYVHSPLGNLPLGYSGFFAYFCARKFRPCLRLKTSLYEESLLPELILWTRKKSVLLIFMKPYDFTILDVMKNDELL